MSIDFILRLPHWWKGFLQLNRIKKLCYRLDGLEKEENVMIIQFGEQIYINDSLMSALANYMDITFYALLRDEFGIEII